METTKGQPTTLRNGNADDRVAVPGDARATARVDRPPSGESGSTAGDPSANRFDADAAAHAARAGSPMRWWVGVGVGAVVSLPIGWLLSYAGTLPFFLGPFFFVLFGLMIGASIHRTASAGRPFGTMVLVAGTACVVAVCWGTSIFMEARDFPANMAEIAASSTLYLGGQTVDEFRGSVANDIRRSLRDDYGPGYTLGYVHWVVSSGELTKQQIAGIPRTLRPRQGGFSWLLRVALSIGLLAFGIGSQTLALRLDRDPAVRAIDLPEYAESDS